MDLVWFESMERNKVSLPLPLDRYVFQQLICQSERCCDTVLPLLWEEAEGEDIPRKGPKEGARCPSLKARGAAFLACIKAEIILKLR